jgi:hypothetical protein
VVGGASAGVEKDPGSLGFARDDTRSRRDKKKEPEQNGVLAILRLILGAGVTPAQGGAEPTVGSAFNQVISPSPYAQAARKVPLIAGSPF